MGDFCRADLYSASVIKAWLALVLFKPSELSQSTLSTDCWKNEGTIRTLPLKAARYFSICCSELSSVTDVVLSFPRRGTDEEKPLRICNPQF